MKSRSSSTSDSWLMSSPPPNQLNVNQVYICILHSKTKKNENLQTEKNLL